MATVEAKAALPSTTHEKSSALASSDDALGLGVALNVSGHKQELQRNFGLLSLCGLGVTSGNVWFALGGTLVCGAVAELRAWKRH